MIERLGTKVSFINNEVKSLDQYSQRMPRLRAEITRQQGHVLWCVRVSLVIQVVIPGSPKSANEQILAVSERIRI